MTGVKILFVIFIAFQSTGPSEAAAVPATQSSCDDCTQITELFMGMISKSDTQELLKTSLTALCQSVFREEAESLCLEKVEKNLPLVVSFLTRSSKPGQVCEVLGLCAAQADNREQELLTNHISDVAVLRGASHKGTSPEVQISPQCTFCIFIIKKLEDMLPKNRTEEAILKALEEVCDLLPEHYEEQCENFVDKYGKDVIEFLLSSAAPHTICTLLHLCLFEERPVIEETLPSDCDSCRMLAALTRSQLGTNTSNPQTSAFLESFCQQYPHAIPKCELFVQRYGPKLQKVLGKQGSTLHNCGKADLCVTVKEVELLGKNHCTWGNNYRCKDEKTAQECKSVEFCQKYVWK
ncbi:prosaposin-like [Arapaima gigas]